MREAAYVEGSFYKNLFTGRLRTRNPLYLAMMLAGSMVCLSPIACSITELVSGVEPSLSLPGTYMPLVERVVCGGTLTLALMVGGTALLVNFILSLRERKRGR